MELMSNPLDALMQGGQVSEARLALIKQSLWACIHGLIALPAIRPDRDWSRDLLEESVDVLLKGWLADFSLALDAGGKKYAS